MNIAVVKMVSLILAVCIDFVFIYQIDLTKGHSYTFRRQRTAFQTSPSGHMLHWRSGSLYDITCHHFICFLDFFGVQMACICIFAFWIFYWTQQQYPQPNPLLRFFRDLFGISSDGYTVCGANFLLVAILHQLHIFSCLTKVFSFLRHPSVRTV